MTLFDRIFGPSDPKRMTLDEYALMQSQLQFNGLWYQGGLQQLGLQQTLAGTSTERAPNNFEGLAQHAYAANGVVFACMMVRQLVFSSVRFRWQQVRNGKPSNMFGNPDLAILERPWPGGTTQDLLSRMIQDADLAGNSYWITEASLARLGTADPGREFVRLRPDWVEIVGSVRRLTGRNAGSRRGQVGWSKYGYVYCEGGLGFGEPVPFTVDEVAHFAPIPDPLGVFVGMSWLTPILREIQADQAMTRHQRKFFDRGGTPNMIIKHPMGAEADAIKKWAETLESKHGGTENAYKNLNLYPGADVTVVGTKLKDMDFGDVRSGGEVRIAAAAGVPPVIVGLTKGLDSSTYSNYSQARRRLADGTAHPLWENLAGSLEHLLQLPNPGAKLWYDANNVPFLREDEKDAAGIQQVRATTIASLIASGFTPESAVLAVESNDFSLLEHTGLTSVQLQKPGENDDPPGEADDKQQDDDPAEDEGND